MKILYARDEQTNIIVATKAELRLITGDNNYEPSDNAEIDVNALWQTWQWIVGVKAKILQAANNLQTMHSKLPS